MRHVARASLLLMVLGLGMPTLLYAEDEAGHEKAPDPALVAFLDGLQEATRSDDHAAVASRIDFRTIVKTALRRTEALGAPVRATALERAAYRKILMGERLLRPIQSYRLERVEQDGGTYRVILRVTEVGGTQDWWRLQLREEGASFRIIEWEPISVSVPLSMSLALAILKQGDQGVDAGIAWEKLRVARIHLGRGDAQEAYELLITTPDQVFVGVMQGHRALLLALCCSAQELHRETVRWLRDVRTHLRDVPLADYVGARAAIGLGEYAIGLDALRRYHEALGVDGDSLTAMGDALRGLGRDDQAREAYRRALAAAPHAIDPIAGLALCAAEPTAAGLRPLLETMPERQLRFYEVAERVRDAGKADVLEALARAFLALEPEHSDGPFFVAHAANLRGDFSIALASFKTALERQDNPNEVGYYQDPMLEAAIDAESVREGLDAAKDKLGAFRYVADLIDEDTWPERLGEAVAWAKEHLGEHPQDVGVAEGRAAYGHQRYAQAIPLLEAHYDAIERASAGGSDHATDLLWSLEDPLFRSHLRLDQRAGAEAVARRVLKRDDDPYYMALIDATAGRHDEAVRRLSVATGDRGQWGITWILDDEDLAPFLKLAPYEGLVAAAEAARDP